MALLASLTALAADISFVLNPTNTTKSIPTLKLQQRDYVSFEDINATIGSIVKEELSENRVHFFFYGEQFIFLTNSSFYSFKNEIYNMHFPMLQEGAKFYLPAVFVLEHLPLHFPREVQLRGKNLKVAKPPDKSIRRIVIDPGHGGKDPGAVGKKGAREKDVNLSVALRLKQLLEKELGVQVLMTRSDDRFVSLSDRTKFANDNRADLFISIHTNASKTRTATGLETFYLATSMNSDTRAVEALENDVVELYEGKGESSKYDDLAFILSDLSQTEHLENSNSLAFLVQRNLVAGARGMDRGVKQANFWVLRGAFMPAILIEMGFISNPAEEALLSNRDYQDRLARTIYEGIKRYKYRYDQTRNA
ncbi:MAG: N-acetylmuramoyl-L-alanine amidase [Candidatus Syntrophosphaera sp.]|nr:N-acetylmuramoyl-L-alanine amidase [Candidatus Syntrophosphaera sp.]